MQFEREIAHLFDQLLDDAGGIVETAFARRRIGARRLQVHLERNQLLSKLVMHFTRDPAPFFFLRTQQQVRKVHQARLALAQQSFGHLAFW